MIHTWAVSSLRIPGPDTLLRATRTPAYCVLYRPDGGEAIGRTVGSGRGAHFRSGLRRDGIDVVAWAAVWDPVVAPELRPQRGASCLWFESIIRDSAPPSLEPGRKPAATARLRRAPTGRSGPRHRHRSDARRRIVSGRRPKAHSEAAGRSRHGSGSDTAPSQPALPWP